MYRDAKIVRSRDPAVWATADLLGTPPFSFATLPSFFDSSRVSSRFLIHSLVDVGDVYDVTKQRFDHHQRGFSETLDANHKIKLSSAGLIYKSGSFLSHPLLSSFVSSETVIGSLYHLIPWL